MAFEDKTTRILFFIVLVMSSIFVIFTCIWKIIKLIALYQMECKIEELEQMSGGVDHEFVVSPKEARALRRLSILAGLDRSKPDRRRSSSNKSMVSGLATVRSRLAALLAPSSAPSLQLPNEATLELPPNTCQNHVKLATIIQQQQQQQHHLGEVHVHHQANGLESPDKCDKTCSPPPPPPLPMSMVMSSSSCAIHGHRRIHPSSPPQTLKRRDSPPSSWSTEPCSPPPPPLKLRCTNPRHVHQHIHRCPCGASFPSVAITPCPYIMGRRRVTVTNGSGGGFGGSDTNILEMRGKCDPDMTSTSCDEDEADEDDNVTVLERAGLAQRHSFPSRLTDQCGTPMSQSCGGLSSSIYFNDERKARFPDWKKPSLPPDPLPVLNDKISAPTIEHSSSSNGLANNDSL